MIGKIIISTIFINTLSSRVKTAYYEIHNFKLDLRKEAFD